MVVLRITLLLIFMPFLTSQAHAQGCAQCLDTTRSTPSATQAAYRHAIELLGGAACAIFVTGVILFRRER